MSYTSYGLIEGLLMLILPIAMITLLYLVTMCKAPKSYKKRNTLLYSLILIMMTLDTIWWAFDIQTGVVDFLITVDSGTEQLTLFTFMMHGLFVYMVLSRPKPVTDAENKEGED